MALTTNVLDAGVVINEINPVPSVDHDNSGIANNNDMYIEVINTSTTTAVDIGGWEIWGGFDPVSNAAVLMHTFAGGTTLAPGGRITVIDSEGGSGGPNGIAGDTVFSTGFLQGGDGFNYILYDDGANEFISLEGAAAGGFLALDEAEVVSAHPGATKVGTEEPLPAFAFGQSQYRTLDGDTAWINGAPTPGSANCFLTGTLIATPSGERRVEDLAVGDKVLTATGAVAVVKWNAHQTIRLFERGPQNDPVRFKAGALGGGLPHTDLIVTADHGMALDGYLINASALVNHGSIDFVPTAEMPTRVTFHHIETEKHDLILANGVPSETYLDIPGRQAFDNYQEYLDLYGAETLIHEMQTPRISSRRLLPEAIKARLGIGEAAIALDETLSA